MPLETTTSPITDRLRGFLGRTPPRYATIATVNQDGSPHLTVIWFALRDDRIVVNSRRGRRWPANLARDRRAAISVHEGEDAVTLECELAEAYGDEDAQKDIAGMARRYDEPAYARREIARFRTEQRVSFVLRPTRVHVHGDPR